MMSAAQSQTLEAKLKALQCGFTWDLNPGRSKLLRLRDILEDIGTEEGNSWLGHIYNLRGYIQYKLGFTEDSQSLFNQATEALRLTRGAEEGPWLVVNYGNLAWLHHHLGKQEESQAYLSKVDALMKKYPSPSQDELHPEILAEKAWTLMKFSAVQRLLAVVYFERAIRMQPDMKEWNTSRVLAVMNASNYCNEGPEAGILEEMKIAKEQDPENLYLAAKYLEQRGKKGESIEDEACELRTRVLINPVSSYSGMKVLLWVYRNYVSVDEAITLAEEALEKHPDVRYLKSCVALCYKWKIFSEDSHTNQPMIEKAISLHEEVINLYPHSSLVKKIDLANIYAKSSHSQAKADQIFQELLESDLEPAEKQMLYHSYSNHLFFHLNDSDRATQYHMRAAEIPHKSFYRERSIRVLTQIRDRKKDRMWREIETFLSNLQGPQCFKKH
ncbi:interferon-induced protein with tetratricopeptide repeats 1B-like isoform X4 [Dicentrarchus labrax]|uniref:interferon-induced protein with tetratricopeptide repeats 1B-like isoform X2 n=1 Tax=Dicentrarchus labrax TaxID=13489 RepID=UPI0021F61FE5|nr:interferon-induced protein with tetratricopeptide repeats 1B-like isoform X2 [Dicentrarchus labrax]XP_051231721.1 interferon-induced protein with tetratricopeptide repeats 1B-like isoform X4 [Dicentrarchus labrax]